MMVPVIDQPASLRATRSACAGVIRSADWRHKAERLVGQPVVGGAVGVDADPVRRAAVVAQRDHRDAGPAVDGEAGPAAGEVDDDDVRPAWRRVGGVRATGGQVAQSVGAGEHQPGGARGVGVGLMLGMR